MHHLTDETGGNIHNKEIIEITLNSIDGNRHPKNLINYQIENIIILQTMNNFQLFALILKTNQPIWPAKQ